MKVNVLIQDHNININVLAGVVNKDQALVVQKVDSIIHRIKHDPSDGSSAIGFHWLAIYVVDSGIHLVKKSGQFTKV